MSDTDGPGHHTGACGACGAEGLRIVMEQQDVPINSCLLLPDRNTALGFPTGRIVLAFCPACGFLGNVAFDPTKIEYSARYEETQGYSARFREFEQALAARWVRSHALGGGRVVEIGCGKGTFLAAMCREGVAEAVGIDPSVAPERLEADEVTRRIRWEATFFDEGYGELDAHAVVCRHTLEHVPDVAEFLRTVRKAIGDRTSTVVLFEVPDTVRVLQEGAFWDVYHEHCSYFTPGSLARLFRANGFEVVDLWRGFEDQYLAIEAVPSNGGSSTSPHPVEEDPRQLAVAVARFVASRDEQVRHWRTRIRDVARDGRPTALWGAGSKAVAFLSALGPEPGVDVAVDINPHKAGMHLPGSGLPVIGPDALPAHDPGLVIAMNPVYVDEIGAALSRLGVDARLEALGEP